eukprot:1087067-Amphidinium_carterae.1
MADDTLIELIPQSTAHTQRSAVHTQRSSRTRTAYYRPGIAQVTAADPQSTTAVPAGRHDPTKCSTNSDETQHCCIH